MLLLYFVSIKHIWCKTSFEQTERVYNVYNTHFSFYLFVVCAEESSFLYCNWTRSALAESIQLSLMFYMGTHQVYF